MSWGVVGFLASLIPWAIVLLLSADVICLPCWGVATAWVKCLGCLAVSVSILASITGVYRHAAIGWAVAGLALGLVIGVPFILSEPALTGAIAIPTAAVVFAIAQWR